MEWTTIKKKVKLILDKDQELRNDMNKIIIAFWNDELTILKKKLEEISLIQFHEMLISGYLTPPEMIIRAVNQLRMESPRYRTHSWLQTIGKK